MTNEQILNKPISKITNMKKPVRFTLIHKGTKEIKDFVSYRSTPIQSDLFEWVKFNNTNSAYIQMWDAYEDMRYKARIRLYNYVKYTKNGLGIPRYQPYKGTQIGITIPILN